MASINLPQFQYNDYGRSVAQGQQNALAQARLQAIPEQQQMQRENHLMQKQQHQASMQGAGVQRAMQGLTMMMQKGRFVADQGSYDAWRNEMEQSGIVQPGAINPIYSPQNMAQYLGMAEQQMKNLPASVQETLWYNNQKPETQKTHMDLKRQNYKIQNVAGGQQIVDIGPNADTRKNQQLSTLEEESTAKSELKKQEKLGADAGKRIDLAVDKSEQIRANISNLKEVVAAVKDGAETGPISQRLPSFRAASIRLQNVQNRLGLDVVGSVTFGALSEAELKMALDTALPTGLQGPELIRWANEKIAAQEKLADYYDEQIAFLSQPGNTAAKWTAHTKKSGPQKSEPPATPSAAPQQTPPTNRQGWKLMIDAQGNKAYVGPNNEIEEVR